MAAAMNNLAAAYYITAQGVPFIHAGEEMLRSKPDAQQENGFNHNSYASGDAINSFKWGELANELNANSYEYYKGLVAFRKAHPAMRLTTEAEIQAAMSEIETGNVKVVAVLNNGAGVENNEIISIFNADASIQTVTLPEGEWNVCVNKDEAGTEVLATVSGTVEVEATSAMILVKHVHSYTSEVVDPTCTEDGYTVYTCECGDSYTDDYVEATGHKYGRNGICEICGEKKNQDKPGHGHDKPGHGNKPGHGHDKSGKKPHCADTFYNYLF